MNIVLLGLPNSGKTTLFNWLTGLTAKAVNYPGSTVELGRGALAAHWNPPSHSFQIVDTPGIHGLAKAQRSADEDVTWRVLQGESKVGAPDLVLCVLDGTQLSRQLMLYEQLRAMGEKPVLVFTMSDMVSLSERQRLQKVFASETPVYWVDGRLGGGLQELIDFIVKQKPRMQTTGPLQVLQWHEADYVAASEKISRRMAKSQTGPAADLQSMSWTELLDRVFLHPILSLPLLFFVMTCLFTAVFSLAQPLMDLIDSGFATLSESVLTVSNGATWGLFLSEGVITGFGSFLVFVPQIAILFLGLSFLEGSGYLARTVVLVDRPFSKLGLTGRSLVPILVGFACAIPAMMATRTISSRRDRWITNFILPLMACSARIPVFTLLIGFLMIDEPAWMKGAAMAGLYLLSLLFGGIAALFLDRILPRSEVSPLAIELPRYRWPAPRLLVRQTLHRVRSFIERAAPVIFVLSLMIWFLSRFPQNEGLSAAQQLDASYLGQMGQFLAPLFSPMGVDWRVGIAILSAFAAREVFVSTLALILSGSTETDTGSLLERMHSVRLENGDPLLTNASVAALLIFFVIALQCLSTVAVAARETGSWKFALGQLISMNAVAYVLAVITFSVLS